MTDWPVLPSLNFVAITLREFDIYSVVWLNICFQDEIPQIPRSELTDLTAIGQGGFGVAYRAKHPRYGTVVYKKLNAEILGER